jgi:hypothetical protein
MRGWTKSRIAADPAWHVGTNEGAAMRFATAGGLFSVAIYQPVDAGNGKKGVHCRIHFFPTLANPDDRVALIQACSPMIETDAGWDLYLTSEARDERVAGDWFIDAGGSDNPAFGLRNNHLQGPVRLRIENGKGSGFPGSDGNVGSWMPDALDSAHLDDQPTRTACRRNIRHHFETVALCVAGTQRGRPLGAIHWGYDIDAADKLKLKPPSANDGCSTEWQGAAQAWNRGAGLKIPGV